jgi:hypothetical protein
MPARKRPGVVVARTTFGQSAIRASGREQHGIELRRRQRLERLDRPRAGNVERAAAGATQRREMRAAAERFADVDGEAADVGALAADDVERPAVAVAFDDGDRPDRHLARLALDFDAGTGVVVERLPSCLSAECIGGSCRIAPTKPAQLASSSARDTETGPLADHFAFGVAAGRGLAELQGREIALVGVEADLGELGRRAEAERQEACGQRIEGAGVPAFSAR